jgi:phage protein D
VERVSQNNETDLAFLRRVSEAYGIMFTIRDTKMIFIALSEVEKATAGLTFTPSDVKTYSFKDTTVGTATTAALKYHNPKTNETVSATVHAGDDPDSIETDGITAEDVHNIHVRAEDPKQAERKAKATLHNINSMAQTVSFAIVGNPNVCAGISFNAHHFGRPSGRYSAIKSTHTISRSGGYTTQFEGKKMKSAPDNLQSVQPVPTT